MNNNKRSPSDITNQKICKKHLIIDKNDFHRYILRHYLEQDNITVIDVSNRQHIFESCILSEYDAIWIDFKIPYEDISTYIQKLRKNKFTGIIIGLTTFNVENITNCSTIGFNFIIEKPLSQDIIHKYVQDIQHKKICIPVDPLKFVKRGCNVPIYRMITSK